MDTKIAFSHESIRPFVKLPPSEWGHHFLSVPVDDSEMDALAEEMDELKPKVRDMLMSCPMDTKRKICLIHLLVSLGLSHHFEEEIEETLNHASEIKMTDLVADEYDLYTISVIFLVFRTYRHNVSEDVFVRFRGNDGEFRTCLIEDVKGMLSLYEAASWGTTREHILDEALSFTSKHLKLLTSDTSPHLSRLIKTSLDLSRRQNMEILAAREYISYYEEEDGHDEMLLKFAKLNFKFLQLLYIQEVKAATKWWKDLDVTSKLPPFFRDRTVECSFFALPMYYEPQFSLGRILLAKFMVLFTLLDDACDRFASLHEVESLAGCVERWDPDSMDKLPDHMKIVFGVALDVFEAAEQAVRSEGRSYSVQGMLEEFKILVRANLAYAKWAEAGYMPSFEEFMEVGEVEIAMYPTIACSFIGMGHVAGEKAFEWLRLRPKLVRALGVKGRLMNDINGFEEDMSRGYAITGINCYMKQHGASEEEALREFRKMVREADKTVNEEFLKTSYDDTDTPPRRVLMEAINCARMTDVAYWDCDGLTHPQGKIKDYIIRLLLDPIHLRRSGI